MGKRIAIVDYEKGNLASVLRGLTDAGYDAHVTGDPARIAAADGIVLPGVGAFNDAMTTMRELGQVEVIRERVAQGVPFLGICLGLHLIFDWGDEGVGQGERAEGLCLIAGHVERMPAYDEAGNKYKIPHVGWNSVEFTRNGADCALFEGIDDSSYFYFTHSYCSVTEDQEHVIGTTTHACTFASAVHKDNVYGVQFHPEKSSSTGLKVLVNFGKMVERGAL